MAVQAHDLPQVLKARDAVFGGWTVMTDLTSKVAVVTGASRGIGQAVAIRLGERGARVVVNYSRDAEGAATTVDGVRQADSDAIAVRADISRPDELDALFNGARERFGRVDIVVANAGIDETGGPLLEVTEADFDRMYAVNAKGAFFTLQRAARVVESGGSIIYIGSSSTLRPVSGFGLYASSKLPATYLVGTLAQEIGERGITVNAVIPTATDGAGYFSAAGKDDPLRALVSGAVRWDRGWARSTTSPTRSNCLSAISPDGSAGSNCW